MKAIEKAAKVIVKQQKFVMHVWMFMSVITVASYFVIGALWPDTDPLYPFLYGLPVLFMTSQTSEWVKWFWTGFHSDNHKRTSAEGIITTFSSDEYYASNLEMVRDEQKLSFKMLAVLVGVLVIVSNVETISRFSFIVWPFIAAVVFYMGQAIGKESGLKTGFDIRPTKEAEHLLDDV